MIKTYATLAASFAALLATVSALPSYVKRLPNGDGVAGVEALGHADRTGMSGDLDAFGEAFAKAGDKWTTALCQADSDGDGQTNGEELGDPCCVWTQGGTPKFSSGLSNPGDAAMKVATSMVAATACSAPTSDVATNATDVASNTTNTTEGPSKSNSSVSATPTPTTTSAATAAFPVITASALLAVAALLQ